MTRSLFAVCLLLATACSGNSPARPSPVDLEVVLAPGQTSRVAGDLTVRFVAVIGDSRCPADAICIQGGDAIVRLDVGAGRARAERDLHTGSMQPALFEGVRIELLQLSPYPFSGRTIEQDEYRATLRVTR